MANVKLVRVDFRLIHGQVVNKWIKMIRANKIVVVDDTLANNEFMKSIYIMAKPPGVDVQIYTHLQAMENWKKDQFGDGEVLLLFKTVVQAHHCYEDGLEYPELQIGGLGAAPGRQIAFGPITLDKKDTDLLKDLDDKGVRVYFHQVPEDGSAEFKKIFDKLKF